MQEKLQKLLDRIESRIALWTVLGGSTVVGAVVSWLSTQSAWINSIGPFAWVLVGLIAFCLFSLGILFCSLVRVYWVKANATKNWLEEEDHINPLDESFDKKRINLSDIIEPSLNRISGKTFTNCELLGPINLLFFKNCSMLDVTLVACHVIPIKPQVETLENIVPLSDVVIRGGRLYECNVFIPASLEKDFINLGIDFVSISSTEYQALLENKSGK